MQGGTLHPQGTERPCKGEPCIPMAPSIHVAPRPQCLPPSSSSKTWIGHTVPEMLPALCQGIWGSRTPQGCSTACGDEEGKEKGERVCRAR